jgi:hypothetical protein
MGLDLIVKINNSLVGNYNSSIRIIDDTPSITWSFNQLNRSVVDEYTGAINPESSYGQSGYEIRISTSSFNIGTSIFIGNRIQTGYVVSQEQFWRYCGIPLERGQVYYGQIKVTDEADRQSEWNTFSFLYNSIPSITGLTISPSSPLPSDNLEVDYTFIDGDGDEESGTIIRWYKNGSHQRQHNNASIIESYYLQNNDIWYADVFPSDGYEYGIRSSAPHVVVKRAKTIVSNVQILPSNPTTNDILKADYQVDDLENVESIQIRWYINDKIQNDFNDQQYIRPLVSEGDVVGVEIKSDSSTQYVSSEDVTIESSEFVVNEIFVDGRIDPMDVSSLTPSVKWVSYTPSGKSINYISIRVGTFYEASNVYSIILDYDKDVFNIPANVLQRGRDYYISISVSDTQTFTHYKSSHFRMRGSRWEEYVNNFTGWTIETMFVIPSSEPAGETSTNTNNDYHVVRIFDGYRFAEIQIKAGAISFVSNEVVSYTVSLSGANTLTVVGKNEDIKIYLNKILIIDGEGLLTQSTTTKRLELGSMSSTFEIDYKYFFYTVSGAYYPGASSEFTNLYFYALYEFGNCEVIALRGYRDGEKVFAINPDNSSENGSIYSLVAGDVKKYGTVNRTFSPIVKIRESPDRKYTVCSHSGGVGIIRGYVISTYEKETLFIDASGNVTTTYPDDDGWELIQDTPYEGAYFDSDGLHIKTL